MDVEFRLHPFFSSFISSPFSTYRRSSPPSSTATMGNMIQGWKAIPCAPSLSARESNSTEGETVESPKVHSTTEEVDDDWRNDPFPLLMLPKEIIIIILRLLPTADRLRGRVCRALYQMEMKETFTDRMLAVMEPDDNFSSESYLPIDDDNLDKTRATLLKLTDNVLFKNVQYYLSREEDLDLIPLIKSIRSEQLYVMITTIRPADQDSWLNPYIDEGSFNSWIEGRKSVYFFGGLAGFSGADLFKLFNDMAIGNSEMVQLMIKNIRQESTSELLNLLGITYNREEETFTSTLKDSCVYIVKNELDPAGEFRGALRVAFADERGGFEESPRHVIFIVCGRMRLAVRKWAATGGTNETRYHNEFVLERFDENGEAVDGMMEKKGAYGVSIADMITTPTRFEMLPPYMYRIEH